MLDNYLYCFLERLCLHQFRLPLAMYDKAFVTKPYQRGREILKKRSFHESELILDAALIKMVSHFNFTAKPAFLFSL